MDNLPTQEELASWTDHIHAKGVHMSKEAKDSVYVTRLEFNEVIKNNAIDLYEMKNPWTGVLIEIQRPICA